MHTSKHGSWLNIVEVEIGVMVRRCLSRRIDCMQKIAQQVAAWQADRNRLEAKVDWQFTSADTRIKLKRLYPTFDG